MDTTNDRDNSNNIVEHTASIVKETSPEKKKLSYREKQELLRQQEKEQLFEAQSNTAVPKEICGIELLQIDGMLLLIN